MQSQNMNVNWAEENLQTIRTLMERSALYRRALAPIMLLAGVLGLAAAAVGITQHLDSARSFGLLWLTTAVVTIAGSFLIARQQALKVAEPFWSPPTRRVAQALALPLFAGMVLGTLFSLVPPGGFVDFTMLLPFLWAFFYGSALASAGMFMPRGIKWLGWIFVVLAAIILGVLVLTNTNFELTGNWLMGFFFGVLHLVYGIYLYFTEKKSPAA